MEHWNTGFRLTGENRCPGFYNYLKLLDSGFRRNDDH